MTWNIMPATCFWRIWIFVVLYSAHQICCAAANENNNMPFNNGGDPVVVAVQLFLVRHGETEGNKLGLTLGQSDSPLTTLGEQQALALGESAWIQDSHFWRIYSSDLSRAEKTTGLILQSRRRAANLDNEKRQNNDNKHNENDNGDHNNQIVPLTTMIQLDARLREMSKGVRQGLPKTLTYNEAYELHQRQTPNHEIPLLETDDDGWNRIRAFINEVIRDAVVDAMMIRQRELRNDKYNDADGRMRHNTETTISATISTETSQEKPQATNHHHHISNIKPATDHPYKVLIVSHSAILRIFLRRLLGDERLKKHPDARFDSDGNFYLPNTSLTILEIQASGVSSTSPRDDHDNDDDDSLVTIRVEPLAESAENVEIVQLTWTDHVERMSSSSRQEMQFANNGE